VTDQTDAPRDDRETFDRMFALLVAKGTEDMARRDRMALMGAIMDLMRRGDLDRIDAALASVPPASLSETSILTLLRTPFSSKSFLSAWEGFRDAAGDVLEARGAPAARILMGLDWVPAAERGRPACDPAAPAPERMRAALDALDARFRRRDLDDAVAAMREMAASGDHAPVDAVLAATDADARPELVTIMLLRGTQSSREVLPSWDGLLDRAGRAFASKGFPAARLLAGLGWRPDGPSPA
jgi:hypothetical protein